MDQPVPTVSEADVERVMARDFAPSEHDRLRVLLDDPALTLSPRAVLAVLKLSTGDVGKVAAHLEIARADWRDVVAYAEYPAYMKATARSAPISDERRDEVVRADWAQYRAWLDE